MDENTRESLLHEIQHSGSEQAWNRFSQIYGSILSRWLSSTGLQPSDVDDIRQETLSVVLSEIHSFSHNGRPGAFRRWLRQIMSNRLRRLWRKRGRDERKRCPVDLENLADELADDSSQSSGDWDREYTHAIISRLLQIVQSEFREEHVSAFERLAIRGESVNVIARDLGMSIGAIRVAHHRILKSLREIGGDLLD